MPTISQNRDLDMKEVFSHSLGPMPWSLSSLDGTLRKTSKAILSNALEKLSPVADEIPKNSAVFIDGMTMVQKVKSNVLRLLHTYFADKDYVVQHH